MSLRNDYDAWHSKYHDLDPSYDDTATAWYAWIKQSIGNVAGLRTLEVACGRGGLVRAFSRAGAHACGLDFSMAAIRVGHQRALGTESESQASFVQGDAHSLPFAQDSFDLVVSCETIEHLLDPLTGLRELHRVARPGGKLFLTTPNYFNFMGLYELYARFRHPHRAPDQPFDRIQVFFQTRGLVRCAGWELLDSDGVVHQFPFFPGRNPVRVRSLESNSRVRKLLRNFAFTYCLVAKKPEN